MVNQDPDIRLIDEFMNVSRIYNYIDHYLTPGTGVTYGSGEFMYFDGGLDYKTWDQIMPVVEKIESLKDPHHGRFQVHISSNSCVIQGTNLWKSIQGLEGYNTPDTAVYMSDPNAILGTKLESTRYNVIRFIKWWNKRNDKLTKQKPT